MTDARSETDDGDHPSAHAQRKRERHANLRPPLMSRRSPPAGGPTLTLLFTVLLLPLALLLPEQAAAAEASKTPSKQRATGLVKHICKGTEKFTNTINLLLTFGRKALEAPRPLKFGENLGLNLTLQNLDTLTLREMPQTFCNESVAEAKLPLRLSPSVVLTRRRSLLFSPNNQKNISYTLAGLELDIAVRIDRNDPTNRVVITSLEIVYVDMIEIEVKTFAPISGRPVTMFHEHPPTPGKIALLRPIIQAGLQRILDGGGISL
ncbi:uncharacterized protein LOC144170236 [Haemaphysalis longicornis]|uniref:Uncharacterized protein n=1 Tax=Haemaphysalis longicornis TaxID=44386 RepID=A0A9J6G4D1_HAELO|nr:hypothetical protein HPB48_011260 [Haemaphysalis longicornis]